MRKTHIFLASLCCFLIACNSGSNTSGLEDLDLMAHGLPIKIKAPAQADVEMSDLGFVKDVTVKSGDQFYLQIVGGTATTNNVAEVVAEHKRQVENNPFFNEIIREEENGFIYKKVISEDRENFDFRYVRIQGNQEYLFQTGLIGQYTLDDVEKMFAAVKQ
ncbi:MAG: hypothetical protein HKN09_06555 [Saprospiraceae bacterium]|nr:hypothetical protein [Saprospiraceae bacterium]